MVSRNAEQYPVRFPEGMRAAIKNAAIENRRSVNAEIIARIEASFEQTRALDNEIASILEQYIDRRVSERLRLIAANLSGAA